MKLFKNAHDPKKVSQSYLSNSELKNLQFSRGQRYFEKPRATNL